MDRNDLDLDLRYRRPQPTHRTPKLPGNLRQLGAVGRHVPAPLPGAPGVVVAGQITGTQDTGRHLNYLQKQGKGPAQGRAELFTAHGRPIEVERFRLQSGYDAHQFRFVVSVRDSYAAALPDYIRDLMTLVERDTQRPVDWAAAVHEDTAQVHAHVVLRGRDRNGEDLYLTTPYLSEGIRHRAQALAMRYFGVAPAPEVGHALPQSLTALTKQLEALDTQIARHSDAQDPIPPAMARERARIQAELTRLHPRTSRESGRER